MFTMKVGTRLVLLALSLLCARCGVSRNHQGVPGPAFSGHHSDGLPGFGGSIKVVSFNISFAEHIDPAIYELNEVGHADVILLQENEILSKWTILDSGKVILPHTSPVSERMMIAVRVIIAVDGIDVSPYSVHTETLWLVADKRNDQ